MKRTLNMALAVALAVLAACGGGHAGDSCHTDADCDASSHLLCGPVAGAIGPTGLCETSCDADGGTACATGQACTHYDTTSDCPTDITGEPRACIVGDFCAPL